MTDKELTPEDTTKLFNDISQAVQEDDNSKLSSLLAQDTPEEEQLVTDPPEKEETQLEETDDKSEVPPDDKTAGESEEEEEVTPEPEDKQLVALREQLETAKRDNQALRAAAGRVPSIQRKIAELDKKLEEVRKASPSSQTSTKIKPKVDKLLEGIKDTDPALAEAIAQAISAATDGVDEEMRTNKETTLSLLREQEQLEYAEQETSRLLSLYPNAPQVFASPHWAEWKKTQPKHILDLATSSSADAVAMAFDQYANDMMAKYPELAKGKEKAVETAAPAENEKATKLEQERLRKQKTEANLGSTKTGARVKEPTDPQALFDLFSKQIAEEIKG